jgi:hypothetical protein
VRIVSSAREAVKKRPESVTEESPFLEAVDREWLMNKQKAGEKLSVYRGDL